MCLAQGELIGLEVEGTALSYSSNFVDAVSIIYMLSSKLLLLGLLELARTILFLNSCSSSLVSILLYSPFLVDILLC